MKKNFTTLALFALGTFYAANAQSKLITEAPAQVSAEYAFKGNNPSPLTLDTIKPPVMTMPCFTNDLSPYVYYNLGSAGYMAGNNSYGETEAAQRYYFTGTGTIGQVLIWYGKKVATTPNGSTSAKVYSIDASPQKKPMTALGTSATVPISSIVTTGYTSYTFSTPVPVTTDFAVAAVLPTTAANGDTVAIVSTKLICHSPDSMSYLNITAFGGWNSVAYLFNFVNPYDTSVDLMIRPVVNIPTGINEYPSSNGLTLMGAYPNPAKDFTNIRYRINEPSAVSVEVFDLTGRIIYRSSEKLDAGTHDLKVSLKNISAGNYYYTIRTNGATLTSKFVVE